MSSKNKNMVISDLLKDFNVRTEDELQDKLMHESTMVKCTNQGCLNMVDLLNTNFINGDPVCKRCYQEYRSERDNYDL